MNIERIILANLITNDSFRRKSLAFIKPEYFSNPSEKKIFELVSEFYDSYGKAPTESAISIAIDALSLRQEDVNECKKDLSEVYSYAGGELEDWLLDETEKFCKNKAVYNAILEAVEILDNKSKSNKSPNIIPELLQQALSISFDVQVGHEYFDDASNRFDLYSQPQHKIAFDLELMNDITEGGLSRKTLNIVLAPPGGGKSIFLCHYAASSLKQNLNVLYITCEMAEERIAERIDANLIDVELSSIKYMTKQNFMAKINKVQSAYKGKLIIKEYPTSSANALNFRHLLEELKSKKKFTPDVIIIDYLNICESYKFKKNTSANSYTLVKSVAEELRAMAQDFDVPILTAAQFNREGAASTDPGQENVAESAGLNHTADLMFAIVTTDELEAYGQVMIKQLKNRYSDISRNRKFILGLDKPKMRFFDVNASVNAPPSTPSPQPTPAPQQKAKPTVNAPKLFSGGSIAPASTKKEEEYTHKNIFTGKQVSQEFDEWN